MKEFSPDIVFSTHIGLPIILAGFLLLGSAISYFLYNKLEVKLYLSIAFFQFCAFLYTFLEATIVYYINSENIATALQFSRLEELTIALFLIAIPWLMKNMSPAKFPRLTQIFLKTGLILNIIFILAAFITPELFLSLTQSVAEGGILQKSFGRGEQGVLFVVRDIVLAIYLIFSIIFLSDVQNDKSFLNFTKWVYRGAILTIIFSAIDLLNPYLHFKGAIFPPIINLPYSVIGLSVFGFFVIMGEFKMFMRRINKKQEYLRVLVNQRTQKLKKKIEQKDQIQKRLEEEKERAVELAKRAKQANRDKSHFMSNISHEMRTPMNGVLGMAQILMEEDLNDEQMEKVEVIYNSGKSLMHLVENILDFSDIDLKNKITKRSNLNLKKLIISIKNTLEPKINQKNLDFNIRYNAPENIIANKSQIYQVIMNLADNAVKFTEEGEVNIEVSIKNRLSEHKAEYSIVVEDTGIGISGETLNEVLNNKETHEEFFPGKSQDESYGLLIVKKLVELMRGYIKLDSEPGQGSRFKINLPLQIDKDKEEGNQYADECGFDILVVEKSEEDNIILRKLLKKRGCNVNKAYNGLEAIEKLENNQFDIIFMDLMMPKLDGFETAEVIRNGMADTIGNSTYIVGITSRKLGVNKEKLYDSGINDYIRKPIDMDTIVTVLNKYDEWR